MKHKPRRLLSVIIAFVMLLGMVPTVAFAADVVINETNFPDVSFRNRILNYYDPNKDGVLSTSELAATKTLFFGAVQSIEDYTGLDYFTELTRFVCYDNIKLKSLDVRKLTKLEDLDTTSAPLTSLDLSSNTALKKLNVCNNKLTSLNVSKNTALVYLVCNKNQLTTLDVSKVPALRDAVLNGTKDTSNSEYDKYSSSQGTLLVDKDVTIITDGTAGGVDINATNFHDSNFREFVKQYDKDKNGKLSETELTAVKLMNCSGKNIANLKGIEHFTALNTLYCYDNQLTSLDVSKNTALMTLECYRNKLTSLNMGGSTALTHLNCNNNQLKSLDVSKNTKLTNLYCSENGMTSLNISGSTSLAYLGCTNNTLTSLDMSNTAMEQVSCYNNRLTSLNVGQNTKLLRCYGNQLTSLDISNVPALSDAVLNGTKDTSNSEYDKYESSYKTLLVDKSVNIITTPATYTVTFDINGGTGIMDPVTKKWGEPFEIPGYTLYPPEHKEFDGWESEGKKYNPGQTITPNKNIILKAVWENRVYAKPAILVDSLPEGTVGEHYYYSVPDSYYFYDSTKAFPCITEVTGLPDGLYFDTVMSEYISGTPAKAGTYNVTITVTNGTEKTTKTLPLVIKNAPSGEYKINITGGYAALESHSHFFIRTSAEVGTAMYVHPISAANKYVKSWKTVPAVEIPIDENGTGSFVMPASDLTITPVYEDQTTLDIDLSNGAKSINRNGYNMLMEVYKGDAYVNIGETVKFNLDGKGGDDIAVTSIFPITGISFNIMALETTNLNGTYSVKEQNPTPYSAINIKFDDTPSEEFKINITGGFVSNYPNYDSMHITTAKEGDEIFIHSTPVAGKYVTGWTSEPSVPMDGNTFTMPARDVTLTPIYANQTPITINVRNYPVGIEYDVFKALMDIYYGLGRPYPLESDMNLALDGNGSNDVAVMIPLLGNPLNPPEPTIWALSTSSIKNSYSVTPANLSKYSPINIRFGDGMIVPGDINDDGFVNNKDITRLMRYVKYRDVSANEDVLDVNGDGAVNNKDITRLMRYVKYKDVDIYPEILL